MMDDAELINRIGSGDKESYAPLVRRYHVDIIRFCLSMLSNPTEAEDAAQEVFIKAFHALKSFRGDCAFPTWLHRVASNHCLDLLRKRSRQKTESWDALLEEQGEKLESLFAASMDETSSLENTELVRCVLAVLPNDQRNVLVLRELQGFRYEEIATILDCSLDAVKARLARARQNFLEKLRHFLTSANV